MLDELWHKREGGIFKHMLTALIISALPTFYDMFTDGFAAKSFIQGTNYTKYVKNLSDPGFHENCVHVGRYTTFLPETEIQYEEIECFETDVIWGGLTVLLIFLPGAEFAHDVSRIIAEAMQNKKAFLPLAFLLPLPGMLVFPAVLILVKLVGLVNPGPEWKKTTVRLTSMEGGCESSFQLLLTLFIIFSRADRSPAWWQVASLVASMVLVTKTALAEHFSGDQLGTMEELKKTAVLLPLFLSNTTFKILSLAISLALLRQWAFFVSFLLPMILSGCDCVEKWYYLRAGRPNHITKVVMIHHHSIKTKKQRMTNCIFNNLVWICVHTSVLTGLVVAANCYPDTYIYNWGDLLFNGAMDEQPNIGNQVLHSLFDGYRLSSTALVQNLPLLNGLYVGILVTMALHASLFYWQLWKPFEEDEEKLKKKEEVEEKPLLEEKKQNVGNTQDLSSFCRDMGKLDVEAEM